MKASIAALAFSFTGAFAAPTTQPLKRQDAGHPYTISFISLRHLTESNTYNFQNPSVPAGPENPQPCADADFSFFFPSGVKTLENYELTLVGPEGTVSGEIVSGPRYQCGPIGNHLDTSPTLLPFEGKSGPKPAITTTTQPFAFQKSYFPFTSETQKQW
ncbi:hypothetical protein BDW75DRAFT_239053 [Aspergillus navahoensis]